MEAVTTIQDVRTFETSGGTCAYVVRDADGNEYTTFRERIGQAATALEGRRVRIEYHENQRGRYTNVYLDKVEPAPADAGGGDQPDTDVPGSVTGGRSTSAAGVAGASPRGRTEPSATRRARAATTAASNCVPTQRSSSRT